MKADKKKQLEQLEADLSSSEKIVVLNALGRLSELGHSSLIPSVIRAWKNNSDWDIRQKIEQLLCSLKESAALPALVKALNQEQDAQLRTRILTAIWQSGLNAKSFGNEIMQHFEQFGPEELIEISSIIEFSEGLDVNDDMRKDLQRWAENEKDEFRRNLMTDITDRL